MQVPFSTIIPTPVWDRPTCKCSDCILHPESSHGMHIIGSYKVPTYLTRRGHMHDQSVEYRWDGRYMSLTPFEGARNDDDRAWHA